MNIQKVNHKSNSRHSNASPDRAWIELQNGKYARLRWKFGGKPRYLGRVANDDPCGLLELVIRVAPQLELFELKKLQAANKSMRC